MQPPQAWKQPDLGLKYLKLYKAWFSRQFLSTIQKQKFHSQFLLNFFSIPYNIPPIITMPTTQELNQTALNAERDLNSYQAKQGLGKKSDSSKSPLIVPCRLPY